MAVIAANVDCPAHEVLTVGSSPNDEVTHDAKGNITFLPTNLLTPARTLFWDFDNQLTGVDTTGDSTPDVTYQYDVLHRRIARVQGSADAVYVHAGNQVVAEYRLGGLASAPQQRYVWGDYIDEPILKQSSGLGGSTLYYHHNQQYSTVALTNTSGEVVERYAYTAYGELLVTDHAGTPRASTAHANRYTYTGREWDDATKLYHFRARWYEPVLGRFTGRDPMKLIAGSNMYASQFALALADPMGLWSCCWHHMIPQDYFLRILAFEYADELKARGMTARQFLDRPDNGWIMNCKYHVKLHPRWQMDFEDSVRSFKQRYKRKPTLNELQHLAISLGGRPHHWKYFRHGGSANHDYDTWSSDLTPGQRRACLGMCRKQSDDLLKAIEGQNPRDINKALRCRGRRLLGLLVLLGIATDTITPAMALVNDEMCSEEWLRVSDAFAKLNAQAVGFERIPNCQVLVDSIFDYWTCVGADIQGISIMRTYMMANCESANFTSLLAWCDDQPMSLQWQIVPLAKAVSE
jgi:RHS repeat-associated protein